MASLPQLAHCNKKHQHCLSIFSENHATHSLTRQQLRKPDSTMRKQDYTLRKPHTSTCTCSTVTVRGQSSDPQKYTETWYKKAQSLNNMLSTQQIMTRNNWDLFYVMNGLNAYPLLFLGFRYGFLDVFGMSHLHVLDDSLFFCFP